MMNSSQLEKLLRSIELGLGKSNLFVVVCDDPRLRESVIQAYEEALQAVSSLEVDCCRSSIDHIHPNLKETLSTLVKSQSSPQSQSVVTIVGADELLALRLDGEASPQEQFFASLQWLKLGMLGLEMPIVLWVSSEVAAGLLREAPDFWSGRSGVFEFEPLPMMEAEQELRGTIVELERSLRLVAWSQTLEFAGRLRELAGLYEAMEWGEKVIPLYERVLKVYGAEWGATHSETVMVAEALAEWYELTGRYGLALPLYQQSVVRERSVLAGGELALAIALNRLAYLYRLMGDFALALPLYEEALSLRRSVLGDEDELTATSANNLAGLHLAMGNYALAVPLYEEALVVFDLMLGRSHGRTAIVRRNLQAVSLRIES
jgi:hypothetical protein